MVLRSSLYKGFNCKWRIVRSRAFIPVPCLCLCCKALQFPGAKPGPQGATKGSLPGFWSVLLDRICSDSHPSGRAFKGPRRNKHRRRQNGPQPNKHRVGREDTAQQRGGTRYEPVTGRAAVGGTHTLWAGQEEQGEASSTKLKQSHTHYQEGIVKIGDATGAAEKQGFKSTSNNRAGGWYSAELVHRVICTHGRNLSSILNIWQLTVHWIQMVSTGDWAPFLKVITATDPPLLWGFLPTEIYKMGTFSQFPVPWKSNCEF